MTVPDEVRTLRSDVQLLDVEVRRLRAWQQRVSDGLIRADAISGVIPSSSIANNVALLTGRSSGQNLPGGLIATETLEMRANAVSPLRGILIRDAGVGITEVVLNDGTGSVTEVAGGLRVSGDFIEDSTVAARISFLFAPVGYLFENADRVRWAGTGASVLQQFGGSTIQTWRGTGTALTLPLLSDTDFVARVTLLNATSNVLLSGDVQIDVDSVPSGGRLGVRTAPDVNSVVTIAALGAVAATSNTFRLTGTWSPAAGQAIRIFQVDSSVDILGVGGASVFGFNFTNTVTDSVGGGNLTRVTGILVRNAVSARVLDARGVEIQAPGVAPGGVGSTTYAFYAGDVGNSLWFIVAGLRIDAQTAAGQAPARTYGIWQRGSANEWNILAARTVIGSDTDPSTVGPQGVLDVVGGTYAPAAGVLGRVARISGTITEAASGVHARLMGLEITAPTVTVGVATVTDSATLYINDAMTATVTGVNYAVWVDAGITRLDGDLHMGGQALIGAVAVAPAVSAVLELQSTVGALLLPRMTTAQRNALTAVDGMLIYNTTTAVVEAREAGAWVNV